jgi:hypothetical protein
MIDDLAGVDFKETSAIMRFTLAQTVGIEEDGNDEQEDMEDDDEDDEESLVGKQIFVATLKMCLQELTLTDVDYDLRGNVDLIEKLIASDKCRSLMRTLKKALPKTGDGLHEIKCRDLLIDRRLETRLCLDIPKELIKVFKRYAKPLELALKSVILHLASLTSYAKVIMNPETDSKLKLKFSEELKIALSRWNPGSEPVHQIALQVPFLRDLYGDIVEKLLEIQESDDLKDVWKQLANDELNHYKDQSSQASDLSDRIAKTQNYVLKKIQEATQESSQIFKLLKEYQIDTTRPELVSMVVFDILKLTFYKNDSKNMKFLSSASMFTKFMKLIVLLTEVDLDESDYTNLLSTSVYLFIRSKIELDLIADADPLENSSRVFSDLKKMKNDSLEDVNLPILTHYLINIASDLSIENNSGQNLLLQLSVRLARNSNSPLSDVLNYFYLLEASLGNEYQIKALEVKSKAKKAKENSGLGRKGYTNEIRKGVHAIISQVDLPARVEEGSSQNEERTTRISYLCLYFQTAAKEHNTSFFENSASDAIFGNLNIAETERVCNGLATALLDMHETDLLTCLEDKHRLDTLLSTLGKSATKLDTLATTLRRIGQAERARSDTLLCILIDRITAVNIVRPNVSARYENGVELLQFAATKFDINKSMFDLSNVLAIIVFRSALNKSFMEDLHDGYHHFKMLNDVIGRCPPPDDLISKPDRYLVVYFLQSLAVYSNRDISDWESYNCVAEFCHHVQTSNNKKIVIMEDAGREFYNQLCKAVSKDIFSDQKTEVARLLLSDDARRHGEDYVMYILASEFINRFVNVEEKEKQTLKTMYTGAKELIEQLPISQLMKTTLNKIMDGNIFDFAQFMQEGEADREFPELLKKLFYQHMVIAVCFKDKLGYNLDSYNRPVVTISTLGFKARTEADRTMQNVCGLLNQTIAVRLENQEWIRWVPFRPITGNLGMYRCSCGHFYGLENCGYTAQIFNCPQCNLAIGGVDHQMVQRQGHIHIPGFPEISRMILDLYNGYQGNYSPHRIITGADPLLYPLKLQEHPIMDIVNNSRNDQYCKDLGIKMIYRHLFDHFFLVTQQEILDNASRANFREAAEAVIDVTRVELQTMANRKVENIDQYFLAHVKNDIEMLKRDLGLRNSVEVFDWLRAAYSKAAFRISRGAAGVVCPPENVQPPREYLTNAQRLLNEEEEMRHRQKSDESQGAKGIVKMLIHKRINEKMLKDLGDNSTPISFVQLYSVLRHNYQDLNGVIEIFNDQVKNSSFSLLKNVVNYQTLLADYAEIVMANYDLSRLLSKKYNRCFTLEESRTTTLASLNDSEVEEAFERFRFVWNEVIDRKYLKNQKHEEVFQFAFMCAQTFDATAIKDGILRQGMDSPIFHFLLIDRNDCDDSDSLFMKAVVGTLIKQFHNKLVDQALEILGVDINSAEKKDDKSSIQLEHCNKSSFIRPVDLKSCIFKNYYFRTEIEHETKLVFDMATIETECARQLLRHKILVDEADLPYYAFKFSKKTENLNYLHRLGKKLPKLELGEAAKTEANRLDETEAQAVIDFLLEVAEPVLLNHLYDSPHISLAEVVADTKVDKPPRLRLDDFTVAQIPALYAYLTAATIETALNDPLTEEQISAFELVDVKRIKTLIAEIKETYQGYADKQNEMKGQAVEIFGVETDDLPEALQRLTFGQLIAVEKAYKSKIDKNHRPQPRPIAAPRKDKEMDWASM